MTASQIASSVVGALLAPLTEILVQVPQAIVQAFTALFITTTGSGETATQAISVFAIVMLVFGGISLAIGITKLVFHSVSRKVGA